jgi:hypothetical protein
MLVSVYVNFIIVDIILPTSGLAIDLYNVILGFLKGLIFHQEISHYDAFVNGTRMSLAEYITSSLTLWVHFIEAYFETGILRIPNPAFLGQLIQAGIHGNNLSVDYVEWVKVMFALLRIGFAASFIFAWAVLRPLHRTIELIFRRALEAEKGPLVIVAAFLAGVVKVVDLILRC